ncbi:MAG TPA: histidinol-phosphate transaminase [Synergistetes bacterium]|nr:histidinol-phosphate transaminase [Synergistota bacterium]
MTVKGLRSQVLTMEPYVPGKTIEEVRRDLGIDKIVKLGSNENPYAPFPAAAEAMRKEIGNINRYPDIAFEEIKGLLARIHGVAPGNVAISHGAEGMLQAMVKCFLEPGDEVILPSATYSLYRELSKLMGGRIVEVPLKEHTLDIEAITGAVAGRTKLLWLCNPNNPTGTIFPPNLLDRLLDSLPKTAWVVLDEAYAEFAEASLLPDRARLVSEGRNVISIRTFSKAYGLAGARLGYALAREEVITAIDTVSEPFNANRVGIAGGVAVLTLDGETCERARLMIISDRKKISLALEKMGLSVVPSHTNFVFFETPFPADAVAEDLLEQGVIVRPCGGWGYERAIRVTVGTGDENAAFLAALDRTIGKFKDKAKEVDHGSLR